MRLQWPRRHQQHFLLTYAIDMILTTFSICLACYQLVPSHCFQPSFHIPKKPIHHRHTSSAQNNEQERSPSLPKTQQQTARSDELQRRQSRIQEGFATPGISSAIPGADNYAMEPSLTEREYFASLGLDNASFEAGVAAATAGVPYAQVDSREMNKMDELEKEKQIALHTTLGLTHLRSLRLKAAYNSFSYVYALNEEAYLWQFGLLQYYFGEYEKGRITCEENARRYEAKFGVMGEVASEERIWRDACLLKRRTGKKKKKDILEEKWSEEEEMLEMENIDSERRKAIRLARQLFSSSVYNNPTKVAIARVHLESMCQDDDEPNVLQKKLIDPKMYKLHSYFYLGLHYDALGHEEESKKCMKMALKSCSNGIGGNGQDITYLLPVIHMTVRDWYDDDNFDDPEDSESINIADEEALIEQLVLDGAVELPRTSDANSEKTEDKVTKGIRESIKHMRIVDLRQELKKRKLKVGGSKKALQDRLVNSIALEMKTKK